MRKLLFLLLGLTIAVGASAGVQSWQDHHDAIKQEQRHSFSKLDKRHVMQHKAANPAKQRGAAPEAIYEQPEGTLVNYSREGGSYYPIYQETPTVTPQRGYLQVVYAPDGTTVYLKGLISDITSNCWVRGTIANGKITVPLGQYVYTYFYDGEYQYGLVLIWGSLDSAGDGLGFTPDYDVTEVTYTIDGDNLVMDNSTGGEDGAGAEGLAVIWDDDGSVPVMEWETVFALTDIVVPEVIDYQPEGELVIYNRSSQNVLCWSENVYNFKYKSYIVYAPDGQTVYIQDPVFYYDYGTWVQGTISGGKIHVPLGQYLSFSPDGGVMLAWGTSTRITDGDYCFEFTPDPTVTEVTYTISGNTIMMDNCTLGDNGDGAIGLSAVPDDDTPEFMMECSAVFTPYIDPSVIDEQPEGQERTYYRENTYINFPEQDISVLDEKVYQVVYAPDGETVYIQDPIYRVDAGTWVKGTLVDGKIHVPLGQYITWDDYYEYGLILEWGTNTLDGGSIIFTPDPTVTEVVYTIDGEYLIMDNSMPGYIGNGAVGLAASWSDGEGTWYMEFNSISELITVQPEGELVQYVRHGNWYYEGSEEPISGLIDFVYAPDGETVYIKDPLYSSQNGTWVKGTLEDDMITVPLGQTLSTGKYYPIILGIGYMTSNAYSFTPNFEKTTIQYAIDDDVIHLIDGGSNGSVYYGPAAMENGSYYSEGVDYDVYYTRYDGPTVITGQPAGTLVTYQRAGSGFYRNEELNKKGDRYLYAPEIKAQYDDANVVFASDGQTVYLQDPVYCGFQYNRGSWVKGTLSDNGTKIHVPLGQYVYWDLDNENGNMLAWGSTSLQEYNGDQYLSFTLDPNVTEVTYTIANGCIYMDNSQGGSHTDYFAILQQYESGEIDNETFEQLVAPLLVTTGLAYVDIDGYCTGECNWGTVYVGKHPTTLPDPEVYDWRDYNNVNGNNRFEVEVPTVDTEGLPIYEDALSYSVYTDNNQLFTFEASRYGLDEDVTEVTYDMWQESWRLDPHAGIRFFHTNAEGYEPFFNWRIGIQFHYTVDGVKNSTNIVYLEVFDEPGDSSGSGDVNDDGELTIKDVTMILDFLLGSTATDFNELNADVTGDGLVTIADATTLIDMLLGGN